MGIGNVASAALAFLVALAERILTRIANELWQETWRQIIAAVKAAEEMWEESGRGAAKREWVIEQVMGFIESRAKLNWLQKVLVRMFIGEVVDAIIRTVNEELGHDWAKKVAQLERELAARLPVIE